MRNKSVSDTNCPETDGTLLGQLINALQEHQKQQTVNKEESKLGSFIQWVNKQENKQKDDKKETEKEEKPKRKLNFLKRKEKPPVSDELRLLKARLSALESNPLLQNVHLSRPATPQVIPSTSTQPPMPTPAVEPSYDKYRVMYLLVKVEQQLEYTRKIVKKMQENGARRSHVRSVSKVMRQLESQHKSLLRILGNDTQFLEGIGDEDDMELFLQNIDCICEATQEINYDGDNQALCQSLLSNKDLSDIHLMKDGKVRMKKSGLQCDGLRNVFGSTTEQDENACTKRKNTKEFFDKYRKKSSKAELYKSSGNGDKNKLMYTTEAVDSWSDTDTDEEMSALETIKGQKYKWPLLNTDDEKRIAKEKKLHTLMTEIDDLMVDVGLTDSKSHANGVTYEVLMMGSGEMTKPKEKKEESKKKYKQFDTNPEKLKGAKSKNPNTLRDAKAAGKKSKSESDQFVEEFDKLLNECDK